MNLGDNENVSFYAQGNKWRCESQVLLYLEADRSFSSPSKIIPTLY